ncbi:hypothetical protein U14_05488 [Candidatus Moduliflexus flocculans]|uniref:Addiction module antidote protein n=1 Tax=Candidatus Moduliflexus flocculans TaxID=1499966 RepID=A0A081BS28_9BACT|nr:hypothetical protein U14_05488 [Candidatus Moduliflexus flocculans]
MNKVSRPYHDELLHALMNPEEAAAYLNAALDEGSSEIFILALQNVAKAQALKEGRDSEAERIGVEPSSLSELFGHAGLRFAALG